MISRSYGLGVAHTARLADGVTRPEAPSGRVEGNRIFLTTNN